MVFKGFGLFGTKITRRVYGSDRNFPTCTNEEPLYSVSYGDEKMFPLKFYTKDKKPLDITDAEIFFTVKEVGKDQPLIEKIISKHKDAVAGITTLHLKSQDTKLNPKKHYLCDFRMIDVRGTKITLSDPKRFEIKDTVGKFEQYGR